MPRDATRPIHTLLIDNYDSYTYNLYHYLAEANGALPTVVKNDQVEWEVLHSRLKEREFDNVVISPGPGIQAAAGFNVVRYHSLVLDERTLPACLEPIAWTKEDSILMAIAHASRPHFGVQFHPESICTEHGKTIISDFRDLTLECLGTSRASLGICTANSTVAREEDETPTSNSARCRLEPPSSATPLKLKWVKLDECLDSSACSSEAIFLALYGNSDDAVWLDSSSTEGGRARFSFMGSRGGERWKRVRYSLPAVGEQGPGSIDVEYSDGTRKLSCISIWDYLDETLRRLQLQSSIGSSLLPFDFHGGFVGYFGYELKSSTCGSQAHTSSCPDACLFFMDRFVAIDHKMGDIYIMTLEEDSSEGCNTQWMENTAASIRQLTLDSFPSTSTLSDQRDCMIPEKKVKTLPARDSESVYMNKVQECIDLMVRGESYEICLTTSMETKAELDPLELYRVFRTINPAPYSAWLSFAGGPILCCCSPERFLKLDRHGVVEAKPIKGTAKRCKANAVVDSKLAEDLRNSVKDRAENLMIVDLLRNDLSQFCEVGTVKVPKLMHVESYATVHQLVSTVVGKKCAEKRPTECIRAAFPGGSMTGAPKKRTMEILDKLEGRARGPYSGSIGFLSLNGAFDLNIVIRTSVINDGSLTIGAGGAITVLSDPKSEYEEMQLKAGALCKGIAISQHLSETSVDKTMPESQEHS